MTEPKDIHNNHINQPNAPASSPQEKEPGVAATAPTGQSLIHGKAWMLFAGLCLLAAAIIIKVFVIQLFPDEHAQALAQNFTYKVNEIEPVRGQILSSDGSLLATSVPEYEIRWDAKASYDKEEYAAKIDSMAMCFSRLFGDKSSSEYKALFRKAKADGNRYAEIQDHVNYNELQEVKKFPFIRRGQFKSGFVFVQKYIRDQPFGTLAARTIGMERLENKVGIELAYDELLSGKKGKQLQEKIAGGIWKPMSNDYIEEPEPGCDIVTTIDIHLQDVAHAALKRQLEEHHAAWGCAILMEVETGFVRAIANLSKNPDSGEYSERLNYAIRESVEPGSTMKLASLMACLDDGLIDPEDSVATGKGIAYFYDKPMKDSNYDKGGNGTITAEQVFEKSSNIGTALLVKQSYEKNPQKFIDKLNSFGINAPLGIDLAGETSPRLYKSTKDKGWSGLSLTQLAIGYETQCTPLQTLAFYNAVANDGDMVRPQFVQEIKRNGRVIEESEPITIKKNFCKDATLDECKRMMEGVMEKGGTADYVFASSPYKVAGKTGTAWLNEGGHYLSDRYRASFVGYFPAEDPKYSCIVVINDPRSGVYYGSAVAAPVFKELADKIYSTQMEFHESEVATDSLVIAQTRIPVSKSGSSQELKTVFAGLKIPFDLKSDGEWISTTSTKDSVTVVARNIKEGIVPNVIGMGLQDALYLLENKGMKVRVSGYGTVKRQSVPAGNAIRSNPYITIELL
jgi:cell division protein FtsI (penicillin-binding protein 3)